MGVIAVSVVSWFSAAATVAVAIMADCTPRTAIFASVVASCMAAAGVLIMLSRRM